MKNVYIHTQLASCDVVVREKTTEKWASFTCCQFGKRKTR
jgi:hypothetical protein